jgi:PPOX class probable F420-dependent enzyme
MGSSASVAELPEWARELLDESRVARMGFVDDDGAPRVLPVTYAVAGETIFSAVDQKRKRVAGAQLARVRWLRSRPRAALTVDRYDEDWSRLAWVQVLGSVRILELGNSPKALAALIGRYPPYASEPPAGPLLALTPTRVLWWRASE